MKKAITSLFILLLSVTYSYAQNTSGKTPIIKSIEEANATSTSNITIQQDERIDSLMNHYIDRKAVSGSYVGPGYRVQVFSSNDYRTAKGNATQIENQLRSAFPEYQVYMTYNSPFWKVRIGDFKSAEDAQKLRSQIIKTFPQYRKDCYTVRESRVKTN